MYPPGKCSCNIPVPMSVCFHVNITTTCNQCENWENSDTGTEEGRWIMAGICRLSLVLRALLVSQALPVMYVLFPCCLMD